MKKLYLGRLSNPEFFIKQFILFLLFAVAIAFIIYWYRSVKKTTAHLGSLKPRPVELVIGFITNFFDTLGIGSFAPTTAVFRLLKVVPDEKIPGTLNIGHALPIMAQAVIFIAAVEVDMTTLASMIVASIVGTWFGAGIVSKLPRRPIRLGIGAALIVAATIFTLVNLGHLPGGGTATGLTGELLVIGVVGNFILGGLMALGIGLYAPCMILVSLLGMNPTAAFPIMMGSCALLMPIGSVRFLKRDSYSVKSAIALTLGGIPAVFIAAYIVKSLPLEAIRWLVIVVVTYTAVTLLRDGIKHKA